MQDLPEILFTGPTLPGTVLLMVCIGYWLLLMLGTVDLHLFDNIPLFDHGHLGDIDAHGQGDLHGHGDISGHGWTMALGNFLNIDAVPLMIWVSAFAGGYVAASAYFDGAAVFDGNLGLLLAAVARAGAIGLLVAKVVTQPMRGKFETREPNRAVTLIGRTAVVQTAEVTARFGRALLPTDAAPLLLEVRSEQPGLIKNTTVEIVGYDPLQRVYFVQTATAPSPTAASRETSE